MCGKCCTLEVLHVEGFTCENGPCENMLCKEALYVDRVECARGLRIGSTLGR